MDRQGELIRLSEDGSEVGRLLECPAVQRVINEMRSSLERDVMETLPADQIGFTIRRSALGALGEFVGRLQGVVEAGKIARAELETGERPKRSALL